ncbi:hypothetical protein [Pseudarthrobacter sp. YAF2]
MASLEDISAWRDHFAQVLVSTPQDIATYKGISDYRAAAAAWLLS